MGGSAIETTFLASLPPAARRWIDNVLPDGTSAPIRIHINQEGTIDVRGKWTPFTARGEYEVSPLSFDWQARLRVRRGVWVVARDGHSQGKGWGGARLWGFVPMGKRTDPEVLAMQLIRNVAELVWVPDLLHADPALAWSDAGEDAFEIRSWAGGREIAVRFEIDGRGDVVRASSPARPFDVPGGYAEAPWHYAFSEHREFGGVRLPSAVIATYERDDGPWEYFRAQVISVERATEQD